MSTEGAQGSTAAAAHPERWTDPSFLRSVQYADPSNCEARQSIYAYQQPRLRIHDWALDLGDLAGDETVLDVGCGNGSYLAALQRRGHRGLVVGMDFSAGMLRSVRASDRDGPQPVVQGDAAALPFASGSVDVALAMHMLYHVPDRARALLELRRVVSREGVLLVVLNGSQHSAELRALVRRWFAETGARAVPPRQSLDADAGESLLSRYFSVARHDAPAAQLVMSEPRPVVEYVRSMSFIRPGPEAGDEEALLAFVAEAVSSSIAAEGAFRITTASSCLVCR